MKITPYIECLNIGYKSKYKITKNPNIQIKYELLTLKG
jgi:hypothetical protein